MRASAAPPEQSRHRLRGLAGRRLLEHESDERLAALAQAGDEVAFAMIVERYRAPLLRHCLGYLPEAAAEDALQQAFINAHRALTRAGGSAPVALRPWLYRVARNAALNVARDSQPGLAELPEDLDGVERPDEVTQSKDRLARVVDAVRALPSRQRQVIVRHALDGESHESIAADLGLSVGAIRQLVHRARRTVRAAAGGVLPMPLLRWPPSAPWLGDSVPAAGGGAIAVKAALVTAVVALGGGAAEITEHAAHYGRPALVTAGQPPRTARSSAALGHDASEPSAPFAALPDGGTGHRSRRFDTVDHHRAVQEGSDRASGGPSISSSEDSIGSSQGDGRSGSPGSATGGSSGSPDGGSADRGSGRSAGPSDDGSTAGDGSGSPNADLDDASSGSPGGGQSGPAHSGSSDDAVVAPAPTATPVEQDSVQPTGSVLEPSHDGSGSSASSFEGESGSSPNGPGANELSSGN